MFSIISRFIVNPKFTFDICFNAILILVFIFNKNYLEEDLIIGLFSSIILFFIFFSLHELKKESLRELRLKIKKVYRIQNELLEVYYFFVSTVSKFFFKYLKKITSRFFFIKLNITNNFTNSSQRVMKIKKEYSRILIKLNKILFNAKLKQKTFLTKLIYLKSLNLKILNKLVLKLSLKLINIL